LQTVFFRKIMGIRQGVSLAVLIMILLGSAIARAGKERDTQGAISVTRVKVEPVENKQGVVAVAKVMLNESIVIREIRVLKVSDKTVLRFPEYMSRKGTVYPQIRFLTEKARNCVVRAIETGKPSQPRVTTVSFRITEWFPLKRAGKRKVNVEVTFNNAVAISCGIMEGKRGPWVAWPARAPENRGGPWVKQIYIYDEQLEKEVFPESVATFCRDFVCKLVDFYTFPILWQNMEIVFAL